MKLHEGSLASRIAEYLACGLTGTAAEIASIVGTKDKNYVSTLLRNALVPRGLAKPTPNKKRSGGPMATVWARGDGDALEPDEPPEAPEPPEPKWQAPSGLVETARESRTDLEKAWA